MTPEMMLLELTEKYKVLDLWADEDGARVRYHAPGVPREATTFRSETLAGAVQRAYESYIKWGGAA